MSNEDAGNYKVVVKNKHGEKANHVRLSMKDENAPKTDGIEPTFFRKPTSRQARSRPLIGPLDLISLLQLVGD